MTPVLAQPLGLLALLSLPVLIWLHRYVMQGEVREVSTLALWLDAEQVALEGRQAQRPPLTLVLLLELLAATALSLWLAGFDLQPPARSAPHLGLVIDGSASMAGGTGAGAPLVEAQRALDRLAGRFPEASFSLVVAGARPRLLGAPRLGLAEARAELAALVPHATTPQFAPAFELLAALGVAPSSTLLLSDDAALEQARLLHVGAKADNVGFVNAHWLAGAEPFAVVSNFSAQPARVSVQLSRDGAPAVVWQTLDLLPGEERPLSVALSGPAQRIELALPGDALGVDDRVSLLAPPARGVRLEPGKLEPALEAALQRIGRAVPLYASSTALTGLQVLAADAAAQPGAHVLRLHSPAGGTLQHDLQLDPFSELMTGIDLRGLVWYAAAGVSPGPEARVLLRSRQGALLWQRGRELHLSVDLTRSNLLAHGAFPVLMANLAAELDRQAGGLSRSNFRAGETLTLERSAALDGPVELRGPNDTRLRFDAGQELVLGRLDHTGLYTLQGKSGSESFAVNFLDAGESELRERRAAGPWPALEASRTAHDRSRSLLEGPLALLALGCLAGAWWLSSAGRRSA